MITQSKISNELKPITQRGENAIIDRFQSGTRGFTVVKNRINRQTRQSDDIILLISSAVELIFPIIISHHRIHHNF